MKLTLELTGRYEVKFLCRQLRKGLSGSQKSLECFLCPLIRMENDNIHLHDPYFYGNLLLNGCILIQKHLCPTSHQGNRQSRHCVGPALTSPGVTEDEKSDEQRCGVPYSHGGLVASAVVRRWGVFVPAVRQGMVLLENCRRHTGREGVGRWCRRGRSVSTL